jgi:ABC-type nitrate/sulfonate/bicarbonate transport system substrate-binding protein
MSKKVLLFVVALMLIAFMFAACNQQPSGQPTATAAQNTDNAGEAKSPEAGETPKELKKVKFVLPRTIEVLEDTPFHVAIDQGYWEEEGLEVTIEQSFGTTDGKMVATGQADFAVPGTSYVITQVANDLPIKAVLQYDAVNIWCMAFRNDSGIKTWEDMKGKTVALGDASWELLIRPTLYAAGLDPDKDLEFIVAGENRFTMVQEGKIDILFTWIGEVYQLIPQGFEFEFLYGEDVLQVCSNPVITSLDNIENNPEMVEGFCRGLAKGMYFTYLNPEAGADISCKTFPAIEISWAGALAVQQGRVAQMFGFTPESNAMLTDKIGFAFEDKWNLTMDWTVRTVDEVSAAIPLDKVYTNQFIDAANNFDRAKVEADAKNYVFEVKDKYPAN